MFTGIIRDVCEIIDIKKGDKTTFIISNPAFDVRAGDSISCNGVCLTASETSEQGFSVDVMDETLNKSSFNELKTGDIINMEPASKVGDKLDGHIVQGHVDCVGEIKKIDNKLNGKIALISFPAKQANLLVEKGSISVDGISLTAFGVGDDIFSVSLVDFTLKNTNVEHWKVGQKVNLEFDILGKYVAKIIKNKSS